MPAHAAKRFANILFALALAAMLAACTALGLAACAPANQDASAPPQLEPYYRHNGFSQNKGRYLYSTDNATATKTGIDVSENQGWIDWEAVAADGIEFAFIRIGYRGATEGALYQDAYYDYNIQASADAQVERGVYFFSQALDENEAHEEAAYVLEMLDGMQLEYPVVFDFERKVEGLKSRVASIDSTAATKIACAFCERIAQGGYEPMVYGNWYDLAEYDWEQLTDYPIWFAEYGSLPDSPYRFEIWQYSSTGQVRGVDAEVDLNLDFAAVLAEEM